MNTSGLVEMYMRFEQRNDGMETHFPSGCCLMGDYVHVMMLPCETV